MLRSRAANIWRRLLSKNDAAAPSSRCAKWIQSMTTTSLLEQGDASRSSFWTQWHISEETNAKHSYHRSAPRQPALKEHRRAARRRTNEEIVARKVRLVSDTGSEIIETFQALQRARAANLDLVEVAPHAQPPAVKIMDLAQERANKFAREKQNRDKELQRRRLETLKEIRLKAGSDDGALPLKAGMCIRILRKGNKVKFVYHLPKRQQRVRSKQTKSPKEKMEEIISLIGNAAEVESPIRAAAHGTQLHVILKPSKQTLEELEQGRGALDSADDLDDDEEEEEEEDDDDDSTEEDGHGGSHQQ